MPYRSDFGIPCCLRPSEAGSALGSTLFEATFAFTVVTARQRVVSPRETLSKGFRILVIPPPCYPSGGAAFGTPMPALSTLFAFFLLGEWPSTIDWSGIAAVSIGVYLASGGALPSNSLSGDDGY
jgi:hypothetical protein